MAYFIKCPLPEHVVRRQLETIQAVRANPVKGVHTQKMVEATLLLAQTVLDYFFTEPMDKFRTGPVVRMMVNQGMKTGMTLISQVAKRWYGGMGRDELFQYVEYIEGLMAKED